MNVVINGLEKGIAKSLRSYENGLYRYTGGPSSYEGKIILVTGAPEFKCVVALGKWENNYWTANVTGDDSMLYLVPLAPDVTVTLSNDTKL